MLLLAPPRLHLPPSLPPPRPLPLTSSYDLFRADGEDENDDVAAFPLMMSSRPKDDLEDISLFLFLEAP